MFLGQDYVIKSTRFILRMIGLHYMIDLNIEYQIQANLKCMYLLDRQKYQLTCAWHVHDCTIITSSTHRVECTISG